MTLDTDEETGLTVGCQGSGTSVIYLWKTNLLSYYQNDGLR